jgi:methylglyoxal/glyoxal reductase
MKKSKFFKIKERIGNIIKKLEIKREKLYITSKISPKDMTYEKTIKSVKESIKNLNTEYIDLYLIHWPGASKVKSTVKN